MVVTRVEKTKIAFTHIHLSICHHGNLKAAMQNKGGIVPEYCAHRSLVGTQSIQSYSLQEKPIWQETKILQTGTRL